MKKPMIYDTRYRIQDARRRFYVRKESHLGGGIVNHNQLSPSALRSGKSRQSSYSGINCGILGGVFGIALCQTKLKTVRQVQLLLEKLGEFPYQSLLLVFKITANISDRIIPIITEILAIVGNLIKSVATKAINRILKLSLKISDNKSNLSWVRKFFIEINLARMDVIVKYIHRNSTYAVEQRGII